MTARCLVLVPTKIPFSFDYTGACLLTGFPAAPGPFRGLCSQGKRRLITCVLGCLVHDVSTLSLPLPLGIMCRTHLLPSTRQEMLVRGGQQRSTRRFANDPVRPDGWRESTPNAGFRLTNDSLATLVCGETPGTGLSLGVWMVGLTGLEPVTSALSGQRSNRLSYRPACGGNTERQHYRLTRHPLNSTRDTARPPLVGAAESHDHGRSPVTFQVPSSATVP